MQPDWLLVQTHSNAERYAEASLTAPYRGATVYNPRMLVTVVHARRKREVERPFLPRYLFVLDDGKLSLPGIRSAPGVSCLAGVGRPIMVPNYVINEIRAREGECTYRDAKGQSVTGRYVDLADGKRPVRLVKFCAGETVRVSDGPFASFNGIFSKWIKDEHRALILVDIFGRKSPVELEPSQFEKL